MQTVYGKCLFHSSDNLDKETRINKLIHSKFENMCNTATYYLVMGWSLATSEKQTGSHTVTQHLMTGALCPKYFGGMLSNHITFYSETPFNVNH